MERRIAATGEVVSPAPAEVVVEGPAAAAAGEPTQPAPAPKAPAPQRPEKAAPPQATQTPTKTQTLTTAARPPEATGAIDAVAVRRVWDEILGYVGQKSRRVGAVAREATVREVAGDTLVLLIKHRVHADMLSAGPELIIEAVYETLGPPAPDRTWQVRCELSGQAAAVIPEPEPAPAPPQPKQPESDWPDTARPGGTASPNPRPEPPVAKATAPRKAAAKKTAKPAEEPSYDEGFDPGDEPLDDVVDEQTARRTSEEQALQLLHQTLGAEKIG
jgi:DNA polymerase-3 subunit gamma/tau